MEYCSSRGGSGSLFVIITTLSLLLLFIFPSEAQLSSSFYDSTCPNAVSTIRSSIEQAVSRETRMAASLLRLHFHDCFVQGCDASILLDETPDIRSEKSAFPNAGSVRGYEVIDAAKSDVEAICPGVVSCADILTLAARDASVAVGGPSWDVRLGRRDSTTTNVDEANSDLPGPDSDLQRLLDAFDKKNLTPRDMVALSGAHTVGQAQCRTFRTRIYSNGSDIDAAFATTRQSQCPESGSGDSNLAPLDETTPDEFDNNYYRNLVQRRGLLHSDQVLFSGQSTDTIVSQYSNNPATFAADFANAMVKMSEIDPTLGQNGIIRRICTALN